MAKLFSGRPSGRRGISPPRCPRRNPASTAVTNIADFSYGACEF